jgi:Uma2 family endonuclease
LVEVSTGRRRIRSDRFEVERQQSTAPTSSATVVSGVSLFFGSEEDDPVELLDGIVVRKMPKGPRDDASCARCRREIERALPSGWHLRVKGSVRIPDYSEPEPDHCVVRGDSDDYTDRHSGPADIALVVEVADSSLSRDRGEMRDNYARGGIPVYWIVNLVGRQLFRLPSG